MKRDILFLLLVALGLPIFAVHEAEAGEKTKTGETVLMDKQLLCPAGEVCNIDLTVVVPAEQPSQLLVPLPPKPEKRHDKVSALVKYVLLPVGGAAAGAGLFSAMWPNRFNGVDNTMEYGAAWKGGLIGAGTGLGLGVLLDLLD